MAFYSDNITLFLKVFSLRFNSEPKSAPYIVVNTIRTPPFKSEKANLEEKLFYRFQSCEFFFEIPSERSLSPSGDVFRLNFYYNDQEEFSMIQIPVLDLIPPPIRDGDYDMSKPSNFSSAFNSIFKWFPITSGDIIGQALIGIFPFLPQSQITPTSKEKIKKSWFGGLKHTRSEENRLFLQSFLNNLFQPRQNANSPAALFGSDLLRVLEILKEEDIRIYLAELLLKEIKCTPLLISPDIFHILVDVVKAALRQGYNKRDFKSCKVMLDLGSKFYCDNTSDGSTKFLYSFIYNHDVFKNKAFWEMAFLNLYPQVQNRIVISARNASNALWNQLDQKERNALQKRELYCIVKLFHIITVHMINASNSYEDTKTLLFSLANAHNINQNVINELLKVPHQLSQAFPSIRLIQKNSNSNIASTPPKTTNIFKSSAQRLLNQVSNIVGLKSSYSSIASINDEDCDDINESELNTESIINHGQMGDWIKYSTSAGLVYYHNNDKNITRWDPPPEWHENILDVLDDATVNEQVTSQKRRETLSMNSNNISPLKTITTNISTNGTYKQRLSIIVDADNEIKAPGYKAYSNEEILQLSAKPDFLSGEFQVTALDRILNLSIGNPLLGRLTLTNYRIIFQPFDSKYDPFDKIYFECPIHSISRIEVGRREDHLNIQDFQEQNITFWSKDHRVFRFRCLKIPLLMENTPITGLLELIHRWAFPHNQERCFAFNYKYIISREMDGHHIYDVKTEFERQGVFSSNNLSINWTISDINSRFEFCSTYPSRLIIPSKVSKNSLEKIKSFRSKERIPVLTYLYSKEGTALLRSSQPLCGLRRKRNNDDERLLYTLIGIKAIYDCRPKVNAVGNQAAGGGYENIDNFPGIILDFLGIENIHVMRESLNRLNDLCLLASANRGLGRVDWFSELDTVGWLNHIRSVLIGGITVAKSLSEEAIHALVHCSDGWDRTAQVCGLAQIILDPYFRTIHGFEVLIEKEFVSFGHKFAQRIGHCTSEIDPQSSPIFIQFLDCVYQMITQFPLEFEFNELFLETIAIHSSSCRFGRKNLKNILKEEMLNKIKQLEEQIKEDDKKKAKPKIPSRPPPRSPR